MYYTLVMHSTPYLFSLINLTLVFILGKQNPHLLKSEYQNQTVHLLLLRLKPVMRGNCNYT